MRSTTVTYHALGFDMMQVVRALGSDHFKMIDLTRGTVPHSGHRSGVARKS
jgi:hypothetical protein